MKFQERIAYAVAGGAGRISPFWRYRLWRRLSPHDRHRSLSGNRSVWRSIHPHGYQMRLSEDDWLERYALHAGHYYQDDLCELIRQTVRPGSCVVDVGANIGFITLCAARAVGTTGRVFAVEASARLVERLDEVLTRNRIGNTTVFNSAAGDFNGVASLDVHEHHGMSSVSSRAGGAVGDGGGGTRVRMARLDDLLDGRVGDGTPLFVKIDVEGFELAVLRGMPKLLSRPSTTVFVEVGDPLASAYGAKTQDIFDLMASHGYRGYRARTSPLSGRISFKPLPGPLGKFTYDVCFSREALGEAPLGRTRVGRS